MEFDLLEIGDDVTFGSRSTILCEGPCPLGKSRQPPTWLAYRVGLPRQRLEGIEGRPHPLGGHDCQSPGGPHQTPGRVRSPEADNCLLLPGTVVGRNAMIGSGSVTTGLAPQSGCPFFTKLFGRPLPGELHRHREHSRPHWGLGSTGGHSRCGGRAVPLRFRTAADDHSEDTLRSLAQV